MTTQATTTKGLKLIGKGAFTKCYLLNETTVLLKSEDPIKECMSLGWFPDHELFPVVESSSIQGLYEMKYYPRTKGLKKFLDPDQYDIYRTLRKFHEVTCMDCNGDYNKLYEAAEELLTGELQEVILEALDATTNYGSDVCFEISPRNVAVDNGKLVLLDCFFMKSELRKVFHSKYF